MLPALSERWCEPTFPFAKIRKPVLQDILNTSIMVEVRHSEIRPVGIEFFRHEVEGLISRSSDELPFLEMERLYDESFNTCLQKLSCEVVSVFHEQERSHCYTCINTRILNFGNSAKSNGVRRTERLESPANILVIGRNRHIHSHTTTIVFDFKEQVAVSNYIRATGLNNQFGFRPEFKLWSIPYQKQLAVRLMG